MRQIKKTCDYCPKTETLVKTIDQPKPESEFKVLKIPSLYRGGISLEVELCPNHYRQALALLKAWIDKTPPLDVFFKVPETVEVTKPL